MEGPYRASGCPKRSPSKRTSFTGQDQSEDRPSFHLSDEKKGYPSFLFEDLNHYSSFFNFEFERLLIGAESITAVAFHSDEGWRPTRSKERNAHVSFRTANWV